MKNQSNDLSLIRSAIVCFRKVFLLVTYLVYKQPKHVHLVAALLAFGSVKILRQTKFTYINGTVAVTQKMRFSPTYLY